MFKKDTKSLNWRQKRRAKQLNELRDRFRKNHYKKKRYKFLSEYGEVDRSSSPFSFINYEGLEFLMNLTKNEKLLFMKYIIYLLENSLVFRPNNLMLDFILEYEDSLSKNTIRIVLKNLVNKGGLLKIEKEMYILNPTYFILKLSGIIKPSTVVNMITNLYPESEEQFKKVFIKNPNQIKRGPILKTKNR